jgi:hypothetical protein
MIDLTEEEIYWREQHPKQPYTKKEVRLEHYVRAYRTGVEAAKKYPGKHFEEIVVLDYQRHRIGAALPWDHARHAVHAAWAKLSHDIDSRDFGRGICSGF